MATAENNIKELKEMLSKALFLNNHDKDTLEKIPHKIWENIFEYNFNGDLKLARAAIYDDQDEIEKEMLGVLNEIEQIHNFEKASAKLQDDLVKETPVLFITDNDNDGTLSQSSLLEFCHAFPDKKEKLDIEYARRVGDESVRGFNYSMVEQWVEDKGLSANSEFTIITADNGINSREEQEKIKKAFPKATMIITDHHLPDDENHVLDGDEHNTIVFNPKFKPTQYFQEKNISGAMTLGVMLQDVIKKASVANNKNNIIENITHISNISNQLDYVDSDIRFKPFHSSEIDKMTQIGNMLNANNSLVNVTLSGDKETEKFIKAIQSDLGDNVINTNEIRDISTSIRSINDLSSKMLGVIKNHYESEIQNDFSNEDKDFFKQMSEVVNNEDNNIQRNTNFIEQLRPFAFYYAARKDKSHYENTLMEEVLDVFRELKKLESRLQRELRQTDIMQIHKNDTSTIMYPKNQAYLSILTRKMLGLTFNEENNGFLMVLDKFDQKNGASGSFRSQQPISKILDEKAFIENELNIKLSYQGHENAAGFFIEPNGENISEKTIEALNNWIAGRIQLLNKIEKKKEVQILSDLPSLTLVDSINRKVRANLSHMRGIEPVIKLSEDLFFADGTTAQINSIDEILDKNKYGYSTIKMNFHDDAIIIPNELMRKVAKNGYKDYLKLRFTSEGTYIADSLLDENKIKISAELTENTNDSEALIKEYSDDFDKNGHIVPLSNDDLKEHPSFKWSKHGEKEFKRWEDSIIKAMDNMGADYYSILDVEATGLGKAAKLFNLGATVFSIDDSEAIVLSEFEYQNGLFTKVEGGSESYYIEKEDREALIELTPSQYEKSSFDLKKKVLKSIDGKYFMNVSDTDYLEVGNIDTRGNAYIINRKLKGEAISFLINDQDVRITPAMAQLTGIDGEMVKNLGIDTEKADNIISKMFANRKMIVQAHNAPYDLNILKHNAPEVYSICSNTKNSLIIDSAKFSRSERLAYGKNTTSSINLPGLDKIFFFNDSLNDQSYSLENFLKHNNLKEFPDISGNFILRKDKGSLYLLDKDKKNEILITRNTDKALNNIKETKIPETKLSFGVQSILNQAAVRNILLSTIGDDGIIKINASGTFSNYRAYFQEFLMGYHFDNSPNNNIQNFIDSIKDPKVQKHFQENKEELKNMTKTFLTKNSHIQENINEGWILGKILKEVDPQASEVTPEFLRILSKKININEETVKRKVDDIIQYKQKFSLDKAIPVEQHNNINKFESDTFLESIPLISLGTRLYNSYSGQSHDAFIEALSKQAIASTKANLIMSLSNTASDSYTARQAFDMRNRNYLSKDVKEAINPKEISFKFGGTLLPNKTSIILKRKDGSQIDPHSKNMVEVASMVEYLTKFKIFENSINSKNSNEKLTSLSHFGKTKAESFLNKLNEQGFEISFDEREKNRFELAKIIEEVGKGTDKKISVEKYPVTIQDIELLEQYAQKLGDVYRRVGKPWNGTKVLEMLNFIQSKPYKQEQHLDNLTAKKQKPEQWIVQDGMMLDLLKSKTISEQRETKKGQQHTV